MEKRRGGGCCSYRHRELGFQGEAAISSVRASSGTRDIYLAAPGMDAEAWMGQQAATVASWERVRAALGFGHKCGRGLGQLGRWRTVAC